MAKYANKAAYLAVTSGGSARNLTTRCKNIVLAWDYDMIDTTAMGATTRIFTQGLMDWSVEADIQADFASPVGDTTVDINLSALIGAASFLVEVRPTNAAVGANNPKYTGNAILESYTPVAGKVGDEAVIHAIFRADGALSRAES